MKKTPSVFGNYTRVKIMACLWEENKNVSDLTRKCGLSQSAVSQHLRKLKDLGMVVCRSDGREKIYQLKNKEAGALSARILKFIKK